MVEDNSRSSIRLVDRFEPDVFWERHSRKIIATAVAILALGFVVFYWQRQGAEREQYAAASLAQAADAKSLEVVIQNYPKSEVAAQALLRLADMHFQAGQYNEASGDYQRFANDFPSHPLVQSALLGTAAVQEAQGNAEEARAQYTRIATSYPKGYAVWSARMGAARCLEVLGQTKVAQQTYEELLPATQGSPWEAEAYLRWVVLARDHKPDSPAQQLPQQNTVPTPSAVPLTERQK